MEVQFLGGADEVGRSALLVDDTLLLDYGIKSGTPPQFPIGSVEPDAVVVSHGHLDHAGAVPALLSGDRRPPIHLTPPTDELTRLLARDTLTIHSQSRSPGGLDTGGGRYDCPFTRTELQRVTQVTEHHGYGESFEAAGFEVTFYDAGHIPGSAHVLVDDGDARLLYTADFHTTDQRLLSGTTARPDADVVVCESTYADVSRPPRAALEARFVDLVERTLWEGGTVVIPAFAIGRTQELLLVLAANDIECYVDGMGTRVNRLLQNHPTYVRDAAALDEAVSHARVVDGRDGQRRRIADQNTAIVTTAGMLQGGPAMTYVPAVCDRPVNTIALAGYQVEGTPGRELVDTGRAAFDGRRRSVSATVEQFAFSAHADASGLREFLSSYPDATIVPVHGDATGRFAASLREAGHTVSSVNLGEQIDV
jgi:putative mRNA 3-end processing factor